VFAGWLACHRRAKIALPGDDSRDDGNTANPPNVLFKEYCVEPPSDPGPLLEINTTGSSPPALTLRVHKVQYAHVNDDERAMAARYFGLIPAAGKGSRFGGEMPKQYQALHGRAILAYAIDALASQTPLARVYVVHAEDDRRCAQVAGTGYRVATMPCGGATRAESVKNGLASLRGELKDDDWVLVHDAVRPCLPRDALRRLLEEIGDDPVGGLLAIPVADTLKREDANGRVAATEPRAGLWQAQTPQMFRYGVLWEAYQNSGGLETTDEAEAVEKIGKQPKLVPGSSANFKVTFPDDLTIAEAILRPPEN
jgi:2-C-methyl-D-erythritol 4-phosphate cytidylyltransferase